MQRITAQNEVGKNTATVYNTSKHDITKLLTSAQRIK